MGLEKRFAGFIAIDVWIKKRLKRTLAPPSIQRATPGGPGFGMGHAPDYFNDPIGFADLLFSRTDLSEQATRLLPGT